MKKSKLEEEGERNLKNHKFEAVATMSRIESGNPLFQLHVTIKSLHPVHRREAWNSPMPPPYRLPFFNLHCGTLGKNINITGNPSQLYLFPTLLIPTMSECLNQGWGQILNKKKPATCAVTRRISLHPHPT